MTLLFRVRYSDGTQIHIETPDSWLNNYIGLGQVAHKPGLDTVSIKRVIR
jgi:hypothetical protein